MTAIFSSPRLAALYLRISTFRTDLFVLYLGIAFLASCALGPDLFAQETKNMIASADPAATETGIQILKRGGNPVDAAIAVQAVLNVVEPQSSGIGGGCFLLFYDARTKQIIALDGREEAPRSARPELFLGKDGSPVPFYPDRITGGKAVGVPGCVKALYKAWRLYGSGKIAWRDLWGPAIELAENGFPVSARLAEAIQGEKDRLKLFAASREAFLNPDGTPKEKGALLIQKDLAKTLRLLAKKGEKPFYEGPIAKDIVGAVNHSEVNPGQMEMKDLSEYEAPLRRPVSGTYRGFTLYSMPPPSSGGAVLIEALNLLEPFDPAGMKRKDPEFIHLFSEIQRLSFLDRGRFLGDPDFSEVPVGKLVSKDFAAERGSELASSQVLKGISPDKHGNTTTSHISIIDEEGNVLSMTTTIEHIFGCAMVVPGRGFVLNNELTDFDALPYLSDTGEPAPNRVEGARKPRKTSLDLPGSIGGKRPLSSMTPTMVFKNGKPWICVGSPGGTQIIGIVLNALVNLIDFGMTPEEALGSPRIINRTGPVEIEMSFFDDPAVTDRLERMGHEIIMRKPFGNAQLVMVRNAQTGELEGASDPRGEGKAEGF
ncbi:MAG TPA: gamma-glutamyltransferase [Candidatus Omnitrophota bacterium]|nr:gamma-glutamyltransferase [Candidatus Omnitrophota bacterium]